LALGRRLGLKHVGRAGHTVVPMTAGRPGPAASTPIPPVCCAGTYGDRSTEAPDRA
jgi:hypothetical protein